MLLLGKKKNNQKATVSDVRSAVQARVVERHRGALSSPSRRVPATRFVRDEIIECVAEGCGGELNTRDNTFAAVRFQLGYVLYTPNGVRFRQEFEVTPDGAREAFVHVLCAVEADLSEDYSFDNFRNDVCTICGEQFYCDGATESEEAVYLIEKGAFEDNGEFVPELRGAAHWACAMEEWDEGLLLNIGGLEWPEEFLEKLLSLNEEE